MARFHQWSSCADGRRTCLIIRELQFIGAGRETPGTPVEACQWLSAHQGETLGSIRSLASVQTTDYARAYHIFASGFGRDFCFTISSEQIARRPGPHM